MTSGLDIPKSTDNLGQHMDWLRATLDELLDCYKALRALTHTASNEQRGTLIAVYVDPIVWHYAVVAGNAPLPTIPTLRAAGHDGRST